MSQQPVPICLSRREREVVWLVSRGYRNKQIATKLGITEDTVKSHLRKVFVKLGVADRLELAMYAAEHQLGPDPAKL